MLECDYLVIGAGASGMAFVDELFHSTKDTTFIIVDKHSKPGGHWNDAYDFVTNHQPARYYGVTSKQLGQGNDELATYNEIHAYYEQVMRVLVEGGRVKFFPQCEYKGNNVFQSMLECGLEYEVKVNKKTVDATYVGPSVPSKRTPEFGVTDGVHLVPINGLSHTKSPWEKYVIVGGGKTGIDAVLYLLNHSVQPDRITWIVPNDYWLINRKILSSDSPVDNIKKIINPLMESDNYEELLKKWEEVGYFMRIDTSVEPTAFKAGTVTEEEVKKLRLVKNFVRNGRVDRIETNRIVFKNGSELEINENTLNVDCTGNGANPFIAKPIFDGKNITLQNIRLFQSVYSASCIAAFEQRFSDDEEKKNRALVPLTHPQTAVNYVVALKQDSINNEAVAKELGVRWLRNCRLDFGHHLSVFSYIQLMVYFVKHRAKLNEGLDNIVTKIANA